MLVVAELDLLEIELQLADLPRNRHVVDGRRAERVARELYDRVVLERQRLGRVSHDGAGVRRDDVLVLAHADHERRALASDDENIGLLLADHRDGVGAGDFAKGRLHGPFKVAGVQRADQVDEHLRVRVGPERVAAVLEVLPQCGVVLDDAVVDQRNAVAVGLVVTVGVGIALARLAVGGPARVGDPQRAVEAVPLREDLLQHADPADGADDVKVAVDDRHARGVIAAVFEPLEALQQDPARGSVADVGDDSTHVDIVLREACQLLRRPRAGGSSIMPPRCPRGGSRIELCHTCGHSSVRPGGQWPCGTSWAGITSWVTAGCRGNCSKPIALPMGRRVERAAGRCTHRSLPAPSSSSCAARTIGGARHGGSWTKVSVAVRLGRWICTAGIPRR